MAEILLEYDDVIQGSDGHLYTARACGREGLGGHWEGWIEFSSAVGAEALRTGRETTQPNRDDLVYWATGLTFAYLEGALERALQPPSPPRPGREVTAKPAFEGPAEPYREPGGGPQWQAPRPHAILDPFEVYAAGDDLLRGQLNALDDAQLRNIIRAYELADTTNAELERLPKGALVERIVLMVERQSQR